MKFPKFEVFRIPLHVTVLFQCDFAFSKINFVRKRDNISSVRRFTLKSVNVNIYSSQLFL